MIKFCVICVVVLLVFDKHWRIEGKPIETDIASDSKVYGNLEKLQNNDELTLINNTSLILNSGDFNATNYYEIIANQTSIIPSLFRKENAQLAHTINNSSNISSIRSNINKTSALSSGFSLKDLKDDIEILQPVMPPKDTVETEEKFNQPSIKFLTSEFTKEDIETNTDNFHQHHHTLLIIGIIVLVLCVALYTFLIVWRSKLDKRYGMREQLVTEDDFYNNNDFRQFSL